ncbi:MFS transporter [Kitasatospora purpeofusca]|uniref:MFS transporter n=1 Tax=Kitasatospora purpeofusca TaxID=67352 RepID=UPI002A5A78D9|nr:MFS transporter [Kitasatospora purpeofusca]MDY0813010.1 MFS transporter [Kitasatospora purpeofusca]
MGKTGPVVLTLSLGVFGIITTEMGVVGVLPRISEELGVPAATAGWLVGVFALVVAVAGPFATLLASGVRRKAVLAAALAVFAASNAVYALTDSFPVMLVFRIVPALFHPVFFAVALTAATRLVPPEKATRAATTVFAGVTLGFAFGVPATSYLAEHFSLAAAFWFGAGANLLALVGILALFPSMPAGQRLSYGDQLGILNRPRLWLSLSAVVFVFAAMFSVYGYFAEYLERVTHLGGSTIGALLMAFGVVMVLGNLLFGRLLERDPVRTVTAFPVLYALLYALLHTVGPWAVPTVLAVLLWGAVHSGGLVASQTWLARDAQDAPEFGNSLFISFSNLGITIGSATGGLVVATAGTRQLPWAGAAFALAALAAVLLRRRLGPEAPGEGTADRAERRTRVRS